ncbi:MAG: glycosyltransferase, partial [Gemmatimonadetes bacterium]|nr:glycosyltransferase [Gemmatimonadota bacterium]
MPNLITGGAERQLAGLVTRMDHERFLPVVVCQKEGGPFYDPIVEAGLPAYRLQVNGKLDPRFAWRLAAICRKHRIRAMVI